MIFFLYLQQVFFIVLSALLVSTSTMHSLFYLIILFVGTAIFLLMNGTEFLALVYLIIYTGAIAVFFLFVIMLINLRREDAGLTRAPFVVRLQAILSIHSGLGITLICFINSWLSQESLITPSPDFTDYVMTPVTNELQILGYILYTNFQCTIYILAALLLMGLVAATVVARLHFSVFRV